MVELQVLLSVVSRKDLFSAAGTYHQMMINILNAFQDNSYSARITSASMSRDRRFKYNN